MKKLDSPIEVQSDLGPVKATHAIWTIQLFSQPGNQRIVTTKQLGLETAKGVKEIPGTIESVDITGEDLDSLPLTDALAAIHAKHDEIMARNASADAKAKLERAKSLQAQIDSASAELAKIK